MRYADSEVDANSPPWIPPSQGGKGNRSLGLKPPPLPRGDPGASGEGLERVQHHSEALQAAFPVECTLQSLISWLIHFGLDQSHDFHRRLESAWTVFLDRLAGDQAFECRQCSGASEFSARFHSLRDGQLHGAERSLNPSMSGPTARSHFRRIKDSAAAHGLNFSLLLRPAMRTSMERSPAAEPCAQ